MSGEHLSPKARAVYTALAEAGTEADVVQRTQLVSKTVGPRIADLIRKGLIERVGTATNDRGRPVRVYAQVPPERVQEAKARAGGRHRRKAPRDYDLDTRKGVVQELFKDPDLLEALAADTATERAAARARRAAREELKKRERLAQDLRRHERQAREEQDPRLPFWRAWRDLTEGADAARILQQMLNRDVERARAGAHPVVEAAGWADSVRHTTDLLQVGGQLHNSLHEAFALPADACPACGAARVEDDTVVLEGEVVEDFLELAQGDD